MLLNIEIFNRLNKKLTVYSQSFANALLVLIMLAVFIEVVSRYLFERSHGFMEEFSKWSQIWIAFLMVGIVERTRGHIRVDLLFNSLSSKQQTYLMMIFDLSTLIFALLLIFSGLEAAMNLYQLGYKATSGIPIPMWIVMLAVPVGGVLLASFGLSNLFDSTRALKQHK